MHTLLIHSFCQQLLTIGYSVAIYVYTDKNDKLKLPDNIKHSLLLNTKIFPFWIWIGLRIEEVYKAGARIERRSFAWWSQNKGLQFGNGDTIFSRHIWERRSNLTGIHIRAASVSNPPQQIIKNRLPNGQIELDGVMFEIFHTLQELMNFR